MFNFFKRNTLKNNIKQEKETTIDIPELYLKKIKNFIWSDYIKLDKFEKVYAFSIENIDDINIINAIRNSYFNPSNPLNSTSLTQEIKNNMKDCDLLLKNINTLMTINKFIYIQLGNYIQCSKLPSKYNIRIVSPLLTDSLKIETKLHNFIFSRDQQELYKFIPPNHPKDHSKVLFIKENDVQKYESKRININEINTLIHKDYDFNIFEFIINDLKQ